jgi:hypothetical protein
MNTPSSIRRELEECLQELERGELTPVRLRAVIETLPENGEWQGQDLLYLQTKRSAIDSPVIGYSMFINGVRSASPEQLDENVAKTEKAADWPYHNVGEAIQDGWRVISFPNLALMLDDSATYGLGCEFILERRSS